MIAKLNTAQLDRLSDVLGNLGLLFIATLALPALTNTTSQSADHVLSGILLGVGNIIISMVILKGGTK